MSFSLGPVRGVGMLEVFGVTDQAEAVYLALVRNAAASVADLANIAGVSCEAVRAALDELARLSLVCSSCEDQGVIGAVSPEIGLEYLLAREQGVRTSDGWTGRGRSPMRCW